MMFCFSFCLGSFLVCVFYLFPEVQCPFFGFFAYGLEIITSGRHYTRPRKQERGKTKRLISRTIVLHVQFKHKSFPNFFCLAATVEIL